MKNDDKYLTAIELADELLDAVKASGSSGLHLADGAAQFGMKENSFRSAVEILCERGLIKIARGLDGHANRVVLPNMPAPADCALTEGQRTLLNFLCANMTKDGFVQVSRREMKKATGCKSPTFLLDRLDHKGFIEFVDYQGPSYVTRFKIFPDGNGPKSYSWRSQGHNRRMLVG